MILINSDFLAIFQQLFHSPFTAAAVVKNFFMKYSERGKTLAPHREKELNVYVSTC